MKKVILLLALLYSSVGRSQTVVDVIINSPDHNTLEAAVIAADLAGTLSGPGPFTVFAPTDAAFDLLPAGTVDALLADIPALTNILTYHVVGASALSTNLADGQMILTLQGQEVTVTLSNGNVFINNAQVTVADIVAQNGVVHVINAVLIPQSTPSSVFEIIAASPEHNILEAAINAADLAGDLSGSGPFTVFAPTDAAFNLLPPGTVDALLADIPALTDILAYHVVEGSALSTDLADGQTIVTLQGQEVTISISNGNVFVNNAQVTVADIVAGNGVVHVINAVLIPQSTPSSVFEIIASSPDHTTLEAALNAANLDEPLSGNGLFTVFAPTDAAFNLLPAGTVDALLANIPALTNILLYHVVGAAALSTDLANGQVLTTLQGQPVTVTFAFGNVFINDAQVTVADIIAENGVVHVIDAVLLPQQLPTIMEIITNSTVHTVLETAVNAANLNETLSTGGPFTVFAPTDEAFAALPAGTIETLLANPELLTQVLTYHVVSGAVLSSALQDGQIIPTLFGESVTVDITTGVVSINTAQVAVADILASNGVVHVIDAVLVPLSLSLVDSETQTGSAVYPNPATEVLNFSITNFTSGVTYRIINQLGAVVSSGQLTSSNPSINVSELSDGLYTFTIEGAKRTSFRFVKS